MFESDNSEGILNQQVVHVLSMALHGQNACTARRASARANSSARFICGYKFASGLQEITVDYNPP